MEGEGGGGEKSRILIVGATGLTGSYLIRASVAHGHPTYALVRPATLSSKPHLLDSFRALGVNILEGSLEDHESLVAAIREVDIVISTIGRTQLLDQLNIIPAIKAAGNNIQRFLPSEYGIDVDRSQGFTVEPIRSRFDGKLRVRRSIEEAQIPHTYISSFCYARPFLDNLMQPGLASPPTDKLTIYGDGNAKAVFVEEGDIATYIIKAAVDPRTCNKTVHLRPPANILSQNEVVALWERKIGKPLDKVFMSGEDLLKSIEAVPFPKRFTPAITHAIFVMGGQVYFNMGPHDLEATQLYPEVKYITVDQYLDKFL